MDNRLDLHFLTSAHEDLCIWIVEHRKCVQYFPQVSVLVLIFILKFISRAITPWTFAGFDPSSKNLLHRVQSLSLVADRPPDVTMYGG